MLTCSFLPSSLRVRSQITSSECLSWSAWSRWRGEWQRWPATSSRAAQGVLEQGQEQGGQEEEEVGVEEEGEATTASHR